VPDAGSKSWLVRASVLDPLRASAFNAVGGCYVSSRQAVLTVRYATAEHVHVSVLRIGFVIQAGPSGLVDAVPAPPLGGSRFPRLHVSI
jgi:hypothetical protein